MCVQVRGFKACSFGIYYKAEDGLENRILLLLPPKSWDNRCLSSYLVYAVLGIELGFFHDRQALYRPYPGAEAVCSILS